MTPESKIKDKTKKLLDLHKPLVYYFMPVQTGYGATTLDFLGCFQGRSFAVETKAPGKKPTQRQLGVIDAMTEAGMLVFVIDDQAGLGMLEAWLNDVQETT